MAEMPEQLRIATPTMTFGALAWGPADGRLALCLHGYPDTAWTWRHVAPPLAASGWRVVAPFTRGYAPSDLAPDDAYEVGALAHDAEALHEALGGGEDSVLIGHDWGALTAHAVGAHRPGLFERIVTIAVPPVPAMQRAIRARGGKDGFRLALQQMRCSWYMLFQQLPAVSERALDRVIPKLWADWSPGYDATEDVRLLFEALEGPGRRTAALRYYRANLQPWYRDPAYAGQHEHFEGVPEVPVLYLHGRRDGCLLVDIAAETASVLPAGSRVEIVDDAGHFVQLEQPERVAELIAAFIA